MKKEINPSNVWTEYQKGVGFKEQIGLYDTVKNNENFFIGRQWEGVQANGLPTPVFNVLKRIVSFQVASLVADNIKLNATPLFDTGADTQIDRETIAEVINTNFSALFERNKVGNLIRAYARNAAVDGDSCLYTYFDPDIDTGRPQKGEIVTEVVENTRVIFGNPNVRDVQKQPWIIIARREQIDAVKERVKENGGDPDMVKTDTDDANNYHDGLSNDKCTVLLKFWKESVDGKTRIMAYECTQSAEIRKPWNTDLRLYPITWFSVDYVQNCYHGQATITGLIDNQIFINKLFAMTMLSLMTTAYPKIIYDKTRVSSWNNQVGVAIGANGGDMDSIAKIMDPAQISPQVSQFIQLAISITKEMAGATDAALGETASYNTSAIVANQRASAVPHELMRRNLYETIEDLGRIYTDQMSVRYGKRTVKTVNQMTGEDVFAPFDFSVLQDVPFMLKLDVGASSYWSEITSIQTLENLLNQKQITLIQFLERYPDEFIPKKQELLAELKRQQMNANGPSPSGGGPSNLQISQIPLPTTQGNNKLAEAIKTTGVRQ